MTLCHAAPVSSNTSLIEQSMSVIQKTYVDAIPRHTLEQGAVEGMLAQTDPHSSYLPPDLAQQKSQKLDGQMSGIGAEIAINNGFLTVIAPLDGSPAARSGLRPGDRIVSVNGIKVDMFPMLSKAMQAIAGPSGSSVSLTIERKGHAKPLVFDIRRRTVTVPSVQWSKIGPMGYIRIASFTRNTGGLLKNALIELKKSKGPFYGYVIDLRNNPGGLVQQALNCCDYLIHKGPIAFTKGRTGGYHAVRHAVPNNTIVQKTPCLVLINQGSASASELMAGALQDYKAARILGTQSFGKGTVQDMVPLTNPDKNGHIKLTIARFYTPLKHPIQGHGITPDIHIGQLQGEWYFNRQTPAIRESDLPGSLAPEKKMATTPTDAGDLLLGALNKDYQLISAMNLLKLMWLEKNDIIAQKNTRN